MIVHVNRLKKNPKSGLLRVLVADEREEDEDGESLGKVKMGESKMNDNQEDQIKALLSEFGDVITEKRGHVK